MAGRVFISYRWGQGSSAAVGRLTAGLQRHLGAKTVIRDILTPSTGDVRLLERIQNQLKAADVLIIALHPDWISAIPRLHEAKDLVRLEIEVAMEFGLRIIPVLLDDARKPDAQELPPSIRLIADLPAVHLGTQVEYETGVEILARDIDESLPSPAVRALTWLANSTPMNAALALIILGVLMLFMSKVLDIHTMYGTLENVRYQVGDAAATRVQLTRELGVLMAWNWAVALVVITPVMFLLSATTVRHAKELLDLLQYRKMIYYVDGSDATTPLTARRLWEAVARPSAAWCQAFAALALVLGTYHWWSYAANFYFRKRLTGLVGLNQEQSDIFSAFLTASTGPDWNIAWAVQPAFMDSAIPIVVFVLLMYLVYGIGSAVTYSYYAFLFNFFAELSQLATSAGTRSGKVLRLDVSDRDSGGLAAFRIIQRDHAAFCLWTLLAMYLMAMRNAYLPLECQLPAGVAAMLPTDEARLAQCSSMPAFASNIYYSALHLARSIGEGRPDIGILFHSYSEPNFIVKGSGLYVCLIASFFILISSRMKAIVQTARHHSDTTLADNLLKRIRFENGRVITIMALGALSVVYLNLGLVVVLVALILFPLEYLWTRGLRRPAPAQTAPA